eukprot:58000-Lingulodinium_polyedra.AAC.1
MSELTRTAHPQPIVVAAGAGAAVAMVAAAAVAGQDASAHSSEGGCRRRGASHGPRQPPRRVSRA